MGRNLLSIYKFIWFSYVYHSKRYLVTADELEAWAIDIARPYLLKHLPDGYDPDTTDPRNGRFDNSDDNMEVDDDRKLAAVSMDPSNKAGWTLMGANGNLSNPLLQQSRHPFPMKLLMFLPPRLLLLIHLLLPPICIPQFPCTRPVHLLLLLDETQHVPHNDGTLRVTVRWNPLEYEELKPTTDGEWITKATDLLHFLLYTAPDCKLHTWNPTIDQQILPLLSLSPDNLLNFISPKVTEIDSKSTFVFGVRVSMCSGLVQASYGSEHLECDD
jgi:hypothetical protein